MHLIFTALGAALFLSHGAPPTAAASRIWWRYGGVALVVLLSFGSMLPQIALGAATPNAQHAQLRASGALGAIAFAFASRRSRWLDAVSAAGAASVLNQLMLLDAPFGASCTAPNLAAVTAVIAYSMAALLPTASATSPRAPPLGQPLAPPKVPAAALVAALSALGTWTFLSHGTVPAAAVPVAALAAAALVAARTQRPALEALLAPLTGCGGTAGGHTGDCAVALALGALGTLGCLLGGELAAGVSFWLVLPLGAAALLLLCTPGHGYRELLSRRAGADFETSTLLLLAHITTGYAAAATSATAAVAHAALLCGVCGATAISAVQQWVLRHWAPQDARDARHMLIDAGALSLCALAPAAAQQFEIFGASNAGVGTATAVAPGDAALACALLALSWALAADSCLSGAALWPIATDAEKRGTVFFAGPPDTRRIALVFDGLPASSAKAAAPLLSALAKAGATATVFVSGADVVAAHGAEQVAALREAGHSVQCRLGAAGVGADALAMAAELHATGAALLSIFKEQPPQQPGWCLGHACAAGTGPCSDPAIGSAAAAVGLRTVHVDHSLVGCGGSAAALEALVRMGGSVLCCSDGAGGGAVDVKMLSAALATLGALKLRLVSVGDLILDKYEDAYEAPTVRGGLEDPAPPLDEQQMREGKVDKAD